MSTDIGSSTYSFKARLTKKLDNLDKDKKIDIDYLPLKVLVYLDEEWNSFDSSLSCQEKHDSTNKVARKKVNISNDEAYSVPIVGNLK